MSSFLPINNMNHGQNYSPRSQSPPPQITNNKPPMTSAKKLTQMRKFFFFPHALHANIDPRKTNNSLLVISIHFIPMVDFLFHSYTASFFLLRRFFNFSFIALVH